MIAKVTDWLAGQNLRVSSVARGRNAISFTGSAGDVEKAFATEIHRYQTGGRRHFANITEPSIPAALEPVIRGIQGLNNFRSPAAIQEASVKIHVRIGKSLFKSRRSRHDL